MSEANEVEALATALLDQARVRLNRVVELKSDLSQNAVNALKVLDAIALPAIDNDKTPAPPQSKKK